MELSESAKKSRAEYFREWRKRNPDKVRENNRRYWERQAQKLQASEGRADDAQKDI